MSSMTSFLNKFDSVDSVLHYLQEPSPPEVVSSSTTSSVVGSTRVNNGLKSTKTQKKEKKLANYINTTQTNSKEVIEKLPSGRVRYGPITVNPRRQPSKTLFTGRRSKYEELTGDEEVKRRLRRDRNRIAATRCREKRESVLADLENVLFQETNQHAHLTKVVQQLQERKQQLQSRVVNQAAVGSFQLINPTPPIPQQPSMVFNNTGFLPSGMEIQSASSIPSHQLQIIQNDEKEFSCFLQPPVPLLTNSAYTTDQSNQFFIPEQQSQQQTIMMNSSSLDRLINSLQTPAPFIDNNNNNCSGLFNSAYGSSSCAQQHSTSSEDDSLPPARGNSCVC